MTQFDKKMVFLHKEIKEDIYMAFLIGFEEYRDARMVCKLNKVLYGLKQSSRM